MKFFIVLTVAFQLCFADQHPIQDAFSRLEISQSNIIGLTAQAQNAGLLDNVEVLTPMDTLGPILTSSGDENCPFARLNAAYQTIYNIRIQNQGFNRNVVNVYQNQMLAIDETEVMQKYADIAFQRAFKYSVARPDKPIAPKPLTLEESLIVMGNVGAIYEGLLTLGQQELTAPMLAIVQTANAALNLDIDNFLPNAPAGFIEEAEPVFEEISNDVMLINLGILSTGVVSSDRLAVSLFLGAFKSMVTSIADL